MYCALTTFLEVKDEQSVTALIAGVEKGNCRHSSLRGRERSVFNQVNNTGTVSMANIGTLLRDGATMPS